MAKSKKIPPVLPQPERHTDVPQNAQWLAGQGAGSWFVIQTTENEKEFHIQRLSPDGELECEGDFTASSNIDLQKDYEVTYPSHCAVVTVRQYDTTISLTRK